MELHAGQSSLLSDRPEYVLVEVIGIDMGPILIRKDQNVLRSLRTASALKEVELLSFSWNPAPSMRMIGMNSLKRGRISSAFCETPHQAFRLCKETN